MKSYYKSFLFIFLLTLMTAVSIGADEPSPVEIAGKCSDVDAIYNYTSDIVKTPWQLNELYALPTGTLSPDLWEQSLAFNAQFLAELETGTDPAAFAKACVSVWQNFFSDQADVLVSVKRTITATHQTLQCISGNWIVVSSKPLEIEDIADWLTAASNPYDVTNDSSVSLLEADLQNLLSNLNSQPGAASDPQ